jgi:DNA repair protein SbcD/Mre11
VLIAHLADLHLGYRAYHRLAAGGVNQRERDVSDAVGRAVAQVIEAAPDLVLVAGDVFHTVRPSNGAIMDGFRHFMALRRGLPATPVVMIAGNHDAPRSADTGSILRLLGEIPEVHVVDAVARAVRLEQPDVSVLCLPHPSLADAALPSLAPDPEAAANVLMLHATVSDTGVDDQLLRMAEYGGAYVERSALKEESWAYVALGHYHNATRVAANMWYAGATERTATNIWAEADSRKGWVLYDTDTREGSFRDVRTREVVELPGFSARAGATCSDRDADGAAWLTAEEIDRRIRESVAALPGGIAGKVVRLVIADVPRDLFRQLDHRHIRELKAEALHFQLEARRPDAPTHPARQEARRRTIEEEVDAFLAEWEPTTPGVARQRLRALAASYLSEETIPAVSAPDRGGADGGP